MIINTNKHSFAGGMGIWEDGGHEISYSTPYRLSNFDT